MFLGSHGSRWITCADVKVKLALGFIWGFCTNCSGSDADMRHHSSTLCWSHPFNKLYQFMQMFSGLCHRLSFFLVFIFLDCSCIENVLRILKIWASSHLKRHKALGCWSSGCYSCGEPGTGSDSEFCLQCVVLDWRWNTNWFLSRSFCWSGHFRRMKFKCDSTYCRTPDKRYYLLGGGCGINTGIWCCLYIQNRDLLLKCFSFHLRSDKNQFKTKKE